jgi:hypothetical protein
MVRQFLTSKVPFMIHTPASLRVAVSIPVSLAALLLAGTLSAQTQRESPSDLLDQAKRMERIAAQKLEADVRQALREAERLTRSDRAKAVECLKQALVMVEEDTLLLPERREALKRMLKDRIRVTQTDTDNTPPRSADKNQQPALPARRAPEAQRFDVQAAQQMLRTTSDLEKARQLQKDRERQLSAGYRDMDKSATPANGDVEFPKDWKERTKGRTSTVQLTAKERAILQALNTTISVNFRNSKLEDVIEYLRTYTGQPILLDREGMKEAEVAYDTGVTLNVKGVTVRTVLRKVLADLGMTYVIKDELIEATSAQRAREMMVVRRYYIGDLMAGMGGVGNPASLQGAVANPGVFPGGVNPLVGFPFTPVANPQLQAMQRFACAKQLIEMIQSSVDPQSWQMNGGNGAISFNAPSMSLIIKQSAEVHALLEGGGLLR